MSLLTAWKMAPWIAILALLLWAGRLNDLRDRWHRQYESEHSARIADRATYEQAQKDAAAKNEADVARAVTKQKEISDEQISTLGARLERIRSELRAHPEAPSGLTEQPKVSADGKTPCRAFDPAWLCVSPQDRLRAAENEERHDQLITWTEQQSKLNPND